MTKKMISWLSALAVCILTLYSCVHDELYSSSETSPSKEYNNKSLWKEDEKYIKNVKKVFDTYADKQYFFNTYGDVYWDYALTMGTFDESFLEVPIVKDGKVKEVLIAKREGDRVHFSRKTDHSSNDFFDILVFKDPSQLKGRIVSNGGNNSVSKFEVCQIREVTWTWTNEDGSPGPVYTYHETHCETLSGPSHLDTCLDPSGDCSASNGNNSGGGDGGGYPYPQIPENKPLARKRKICSQTHKYRLKLMS